jgi:N-acetylmuramoyl-L-alanine amidase
MISRNKKADLFISLHADASPDRDTYGLSIYTLSDSSSDKQAALLAQKENKSDIIGGADFSDASGDILKTLINLSQRNTMNESAKFAEIAIRSVRGNGVETLQRTHRFAGFRVLTAPDVPSVLIELGYLSNKKEEKRLNSLNHKKQVSEALVKAVDKYFDFIK